MTKRCKENEKIYVKAFSRATVNDMKHYCKPAVESKPDAVILHLGTNDLRNKNLYIYIYMAGKRLSN